MGDARGTTKQDDCLAEITRNESTGGGIGVEIRLLKGSDPSRHCRRSKDAKESRSEYRYLFVMDICDRWIGRKECGLRTWTGLLGQKYIQQPVV